MNNGRAGISSLYTGFLNQKKSFLSRFLFGTFISRVTIAHEYVNELKELSQKGIIVFAQKNKSQLNCLIVGDILSRTIKGNLFCYGINMSFWQPFSVNLKIFMNRMLYFVFNRQFPVQKGILKEIHLNNGHSIIYLRGSEFLSLKSVKDPIIQLIHSREGVDCPVYIVPLMVSYSKRRERTHNTFLEILLGMKENPGPLRRTITFLRHSRKAKILCSRPIDLNEILEKNKGKSLETVSFNIRRELIQRIDDEKRAIFGPVLKSRDELMETVLRDTYLVKYMEESAVKGSKSFRSISREAKKYLEEIAADFNEIYIEIFYKLLTWLWNNIYDGIIIDQRGFTEIKEISKKMPFVIIPCHRSHIDYSLLHYVMENNEIPLPFIAAGSNLGFWPLGTIFRKSGAFFIRRSFKGQNLYRTVLSKYIKVLLKEGFPIEFFIEGGRSRTGKMDMPKHGLLSMIIQAYNEGISDDLALIPVYLGYDKIIEEKAYLQELGGEPQRPERMLDLLKTSRILRKRFGSVYVNVGNPIFLKSYLADIQRNYENMSNEERRNLYRRIGYEIADEINKATVVTPFSLAACSLLCHYRRGISHDELISIHNAFYDWLHYKDVKFASTFANKTTAIESALNLFEQSGLIAKMGIEEEDQDEDIEEIVYSVQDEYRPNLEYYKNNIIHYFIPLAYVSVAILSSRQDIIPISQIKDDYIFLKSLFKNEFIIDHKTDDGDEINHILKYMSITGMIVVDESCARIEVRGKGRTDMKPFAGLIHNYIESYWVVLRGCSYLKKESRSERDFFKKIHILGTRMYKKGEIERVEALSTQSYRNAMKFFSDTQIFSIDIVKEKKERENRVYVLSHDRNKIETLRQKLFRFI